METHNSPCWVYKSARRGDICWTSWHRWGRGSAWGGNNPDIRGCVRGSGHLNVLLASLTWPCTWFSCCCTARCSGLGWSSVGRSPGKRDNHHTRNCHMWNFIFWHGKNRRNFYPTWLWSEPVLHFWRMSQVSKCCEAIPQVATDTHCILVDRCICVYIVYQIIIITIVNWWVE